MASTGDDKNEPQLELPSLSLPRLGRRRAKPAPGPERAPERAPDSAPERVAVPDHERTQEFAAPQDPTPPAAPVPAPPPAAQAPAPPGGTPPGGTRRAERSGSALPVPSLPGPVAAGVTGLVVGAGGAAVTSAALAACEAVRGVSTCGGGPGFLILVAIVVLMVLAGALLLRLFGVSAGVSTSFLAVGIVTVLAMLLLLDVILSPWMFLVIPLLSGASYLLSHSVTTRYENEDVGRRDWR